MNIYDAAKILGLNGDITQDDVLLAYRKAAFKYHPDRNPAGGEMMKAVNAPYEVLKAFSGNVEHKAGDYGEELNRMINAALDIQVTAGGTIMPFGSNAIRVRVKTFVHCIKFLLPKRGFSQLLNSFNSAPELRYELR